MPNPLDPQDLNRFSYVRNNPLRYVDPSGHICTDPEDPTPSCDGSGGYPSNITPLPPAPVVITNPDPLDDGLEQDDPTPSTSNNNGGSNGGLNGGTNGECDVGHCYESTNVVCPAVFECTSEEIQYYATLFQYPGQATWNPVQNGHSYYVFPAPQLAVLLKNPMLILLGAITVDISDDGLTLINQSQPTHIFHNGKVVRDYSQNADGSWMVTSTGTGTNDTPVVGSYIDGINDAIGPITFNFVDAMMKVYITVDQLFGSP